MQKTKLVSAAKLVTPEDRLHTDSQVPGMPPKKVERPVACYIRNTKTIYGPNDSR